MKARSLALIVLILVTLVTLSTFIRSYARESMDQQPMPTLAPSLPEQEGELNPDLWPTAVPLAKPLETPEEVLKHLSAIDAGWAEWQEPWGVNTLAITPSRIIVESYSSRAEESKAMGFNEWFHPVLETDAGAVWSITIKGEVKLNMIGMGVDGPIPSDGVNYVISARTGDLLAVRGGVPERFK